MNEKNNEVTITIQVGNGRSVVKTLSETEAIALGLVTAKPKFWTPVSGEKCHCSTTPFYAKGEANFKFYPQYSEDIAIENAGLLFQKQEEAKEHFEYLCAIKRIKDYCLENFGEFIPDWKCREQNKYSIKYLHFEGYFSYEVNQRNQFQNCIPFFLSRHECLQVIKDCEKDLKIVFGIE